MKGDKGRGDIEVTYESQKQQVGGVTRNGKDRERKIFFSCMLELFVIIEEFKFGSTLYLLPRHHFFGSKNNRSVNLTYVSLLF